MENEDDKMFDLNNNNNVLDSQMIDLKEDTEEDIVGLDVIEFMAIKRYSFLGLDLTVQIHHIIK